MFNRTEKDKISTVLNHNTFYFFNEEFEEQYNVQTIGLLSNLLFNVQEQVKHRGVQKEIFDELLQKSHGLKAMLTLNGFSTEQLKRVITVARIVQEPNLDKLLMRKFWSKQDTVGVETISEWSTTTIKRLVQSDEAFRKGIVNLAFDGASDTFLTRVLPPFELAKLSIRKLSFEIEPMIDTLVRYKEKGSYSGKSENNAETAIKRILDKFSLQYETGDLNELINSEFSQKRTMDFIIPDQKNAKVIIESSYLATTSSGQGDKAKTEIHIGNLIKKHYPKALFIGFVDGVGWYARKGDLKRMVSAYDDVFTFHEDELLRFELFLTQVFS